MTQPRDPDSIIATWLDDGPIDLPADTRRAIVVGLRTQPRVRRMAILRGLPMFAISRLVTAAAIVLAVGGLSIFVLANRSTGLGSGPSPTPSSAAGSPSSAPSSVAPSASVVEASIPPLTQTFVSPKYGYSVRLPSDWTTEAATTIDPWQPGQQPEPSGEPFDFMLPPGGGLFRGASAVIPGGAVVDDWIRQFITQSDVAVCNPARDSLEPVTIDGQAGRLRGFCDDAKEVEATVVVGKRVYVFTLYLGERANTEAGERALLNALLATIALNPADAQVTPKPSSS